MFLIEIKLKQGPVFVYAVNYCCRTFIRDQNAMHLVRMTLYTCDRVGLLVWELLFEIQEECAQLFRLQVEDVNVPTGHANEHVPVIERLVCKLSGCVHVGCVNVLFNRNLDLN